MKCPLFLYNFNKILILSTNFSKIRQYKISRKYTHREHSCPKLAEEGAESHNVAKNRVLQLCECAKKGGIKFFPVLN
jgi:hypothetical protein